MSVLSPKRVILFVAVTLSALPLFATNPSPRLSPRLAFDEQAGIGILFGGRGLSDPATALEHGTDETWSWNRNHWVQLFPEVSPPARSAHAMVYDSIRHRVIVFGGRKEATVVRQKFGIHGDTWAGEFVDGEWTWHELAPANSPEARYFQGMAFDRDRDRVMLYGGFNYTADGKNLQALFDTWEFDGETWTRVAQNGPEISKPLLVFDVTRHETLMLGTATADAKPAMYRWNNDAKRWDSVTPSLLPACVNEAQLTYQFHNQRPFLSGGLCGGSGLGDEAYEWDGSTWVKITTPKGFATTRQVDAAITYDTVAQQVVRFGGHNSLTPNPNSVTSVYRATRWRDVASNGNPSPRSMPLFRRDPQQNVVWLFGGINEYSVGSFIDYNSDIWRYSDGEWSLATPATFGNTPLGCVTPAGAMDIDRDVLVVVCNGNEMYEWNGTDWKAFSSLDKTPSSRRFASAAYDQNLKKVVLFGGYDTFGTYKQDMWTWDGKAWAELKPDKKPEHRAQAVMWFDPLAKKTILYGGVGAKNIDTHAKRYSDMWSFDGTNWTRITEEAKPGIRFAPQIAIDPTTGKVLMFGGLRVTVDEEDRVSQFYDNDLWMWDGGTSTWTEIQTERAPGPRQNGAFEYDPVSGKFVLFGGFYGNFYLSDRWLWDGQTWTVVPDVPSFRRRSVRP